jgi:hypothetical protein
MCLPGSVTRFDRVGRYPPLLQLLPLSNDEAREFLESGAKSIGRNALFTHDAARLVVAQSAGSPRLLRRNASLAYFSAATDGQHRISAEHVAQALEANNFAPAKDPNAGKSWTNADPNDHSALYQKGPAQPAKPSAPAALKSAPLEKAPEPKRVARKLSEFALYSSPTTTLREFSEALRAEKEELELEKMKRREANRIFYHSWRFGK